jgi:hypothetical protein
MKANTFLIKCTSVLGKLLSIAILTALMLSQFSCENAELEFSCDPAINAYVKENQAELALICVDELLRYSLPLQRAIYTSWDYVKKREAWLYKMYYILSNENYDQAGASHIQALIDHISGECFTEVLYVPEEMIQFAGDWIKYASNNLGWPDSYISFVVFRLYLEPDQMLAESELKTIGNKSIANSESPDCECNQSADFCGLSTHCVNSGCNTVMGCGWLWSMSCNGRCDLYD